MSIYPSSIQKNRKNKKGLVITEGVITNLTGLVFSNMNYYVDYLWRYYESIRFGVFKHESLRLIEKTK